MTGLMHLQGPRLLVVSRTWRNVILDAVAHHSETFLSLGTCGVVLSGSPLCLRDVERVSFTLDHLRVLRIECTITITDGSVYPGYVVQIWSSQARNGFMGY